MCYENPSRQCVWSARVTRGPSSSKLFALNEIMRDVANQLGEQPSKRYLDFPKDRVARLEAAVGLLVHVETYAASNKLEPVMPEYVAFFDSKHRRDRPLQGQVYCLGARCGDRRARHAPVFAEGAVRARWLCCGAAAYDRVLSLLPISAFCPSGNFPSR